MYYKLSENGEIACFTDNKKVADNLGMTLETDTEIVYGYDGKCYFKGSAPTPPEPTYNDKRASEYPKISDQLDMIYWDQINGTHLWQDKITEIKNKYPKV